MFFRKKDCLFLQELIKELSIEGTSLEEFVESIVELHYRYIANVAYFGSQEFIKENPDCTLEQFVEEFGKHLKERVEGARAK